MKERIMKRRTLVQVLLVGILAMSITTSANAYVIGAEHQYYSDSGFTNLVGVEWIPGICCPEYDYDSWGDVETTYRIAIGYDYCGWEQQNASNCQSYYGGSWHLVQCP
jgi:hypothetical protein